MKRFFYAVAMTAGLWPAPLQSQIYDTYVTETNVTYVCYDQVAPVPGHPELVLGGDGECDVRPGPARCTQSFIPAMPQISFIDLIVLDDFAGDGQDSHVYVVLRSGSIDGPIIASTDPVTIPNGYQNFNNEWTRFMFPSRVRIHPFETYYFQPAVQPSSLGISVKASFSQYTAGILYYGTKPSFGPDIYFREGCIDVYPIPEPSTVTLALVGLPALAWAMGKRERPSLR
jgi:hypothetical protein